MDLGEVNLPRIRNPVSVCNSKVEDKASGHSARGVCDTLDDEFVGANETHARKSLHGVREVGSNRTRWKACLGWTEWMRLVRERTRGVPLATRRNRKPPLDGATSLRKATGWNEDGQE